MRRIIQFVTLLWLVCLPPLAEAKPVRWWLVGVTFSSGTTATGFFVLDADTTPPTFSSWNISIGNESTVGCTNNRCVFSPATNVNFPDQSFPVYFLPPMDDANVYLVDFTTNTVEQAQGGTAFLLLNLGSNGLTDAGGAVPIVPFPTGAQLVRDGSAVLNEDTSQTDVIVAGQLCSTAGCQPSCVTNGYVTCVPIPVITHGVATSAPTICELDPSICEPVCVLPCSNPIVSWPIPPFNGAVDPWLNNTSVTIEGVTWEESNDLAGNLTVQLSDEGLAQVQSGRLASQQIADRRAASRFRGKIVGPYVNITAKPDVTPLLERLAKSKGPMIRLSLPYFDPLPVAGTRRRLMVFDEATARWMDVDGQTEDRSKKRISARVHAPGRYTIIAEIPSREH